MSGSNRIEGNGNYPTSYPQEDFSDLDSEENYGREDRYAESSFEYGDQEGSSHTLSVSEAERRLKEIIRQIQAGAGSAEEKMKLREKVYTLQRALQDSDESAMPEISSKIFAFEAQVYGNGLEGGEGKSSGNSEQDETLSQQIQEIKDKINALTLPQEKKDELLSKLESSQNLGEEEAQASLDEVSEQVDLYSKASYPAVSLAEKTGMNAEDIEKIAKKHNIDLKNPPQTPSKDLLEFLKEVHPELADAFQEVKKAAEDRQSSYQESLTKAKSQNEANHSSTTDSDIKDVAPFQNLYDTKYYQDPKSKALVEAMQAARKIFVDDFQAMNPDVKVENVEPTPESGWKLAYSKALAADQIKIGGTFFDLFNNTDGSAQISQTPDEEKLETVAVVHDNEGDGSWTPVGNGYGEEFKRDSYDGGELAPLWADTAAGWHIGNKFIPVVGGIVGGAIGLGVGVVHNIIDGVVDLF